MRWFVIFLIVMVHLVRFKTIALQSDKINDATVDQSNLRCSLYFSALYTHRQLTNFFGQVAVSVMLE